MPPETKEFKVPTGQLVDYEAAWRDLFSLMSYHERFMNFSQQPGKQPFENSILVLMRNIQAQYTLEVPIQ